MSDYQDACPVRAAPQRFCRRPLAAFVAALVLPVGLSLAVSAHATRTTSETAAAGAIGRSASASTATAGTSGATTTAAAETTSAAATAGSGTTQDAAARAAASQSSTTQNAAAAAQGTAQNATAPATAGAGAEAAGAAGAGAAAGATGAAGEAGAAATPSTTDAQSSNTQATPTDAALQAAGVTDHGVPTQVSQTRGIISTADANGADVVVTWLQDWRGGYSILMINPDTGETEQFNTPFDPEGDEPSAVYLSSKNRLYTLFNSQFVEFDINSRSFTFTGKTEGKTAMSLTEDGNGVIWAGTYPNNELVAFNPTSKTLENHGALSKESWAQYPRSIAVDQQGWVYVGTGLAASQIYAYNPSARTSEPLVPTAQRIAGTGVVSQSDSGVVYGTNGNSRYVLSGGKASALSPEDKTAPSSLTTGAQNLTDREFPSKRRLVELDMDAHKLVTRDASGQNREVTFKYESEGALLTFVCAMDDGTVCGGTRFPMHTFLQAKDSTTFDSKKIERQPNIIVPVGKRMYVGAYPDGKLLQEKEEGKNEFEEVLSARPSVNRPHALVARQGGAQMVMAGTPEYGMTGGGMVFWNRDSGEKEQLDHTQLIPDHSVQALIELADGTLMGGTTVKPGTGGVTKASSSAEVFLMDPNTKQVRWHGAPVEGAQTITDLTLTPEGLVYGLADSVNLFVFNPGDQQVVTVNRFSREFGPSVFAQGTRAFVKTTAPSAADAKPGGQSVYLLLSNGIARIDTATHQLSRVMNAPSKITVGGAAANGRIYFGSNNHLYSWQVK